ncbi:hypothetical protein ACFLTP_06575 [Chloroflexota bacterium]
MLIRANALLVVIETNDIPLSHINDTLVQLKELRIAPHKNYNEEGIIFYENKSLIVANKIDLFEAHLNYIDLKHQF